MTEANSSSPSSSRLMITHMVLENFKSYAGEQHIGPFHKCFSSIVGPNGSGKSNVIDALLFVFGKRAKQLRLNKVSELIHKSSNFPDLEFARVSVHFQLIQDVETSEDDYTVVANSGFVVSRIAYKNNTSKYTVDAKSSTYTEVGQLLRSHGVDLDNNRFLILQGEVEQIAMMKPKAQTPHEEGLLEYLEDIIGSNQFVERIEAASKTLEEINEQRTEKVNRVKVAEKERENLSGSKAEAEAYLAKDREVRQKKNVLYQVYESISLTNASDLTVRLDKASDKLAHEKAKLKENEDKYVAKEREFDSTNNQYKEVDQELQRATSEFGAFERRDVKLQEDMKHAKTQLKKAQASIAKESKKEEDCLADAANAQKEVESARAAVEEVQAKKEHEERVRDEIMESLQEATREPREQLELAQTQLADAERGVAGLQTEKETVLTAIQLVESRVRDAQKAAEATLEKIAACDAEGERVAGRISEASKEMKQIQKQIEKTTGDISKEDDKEASLQDGVRRATTASEETKALFASQQLNSTSATNKVVTAIMKASKKGGPLATAGVRGRLGDLGTISAEFDVAISTACGMLDHIVVETSEGGQACIEYLKANNLGRTTFICLAQLEQWAARMDRVTSTPENIPRLFDLVNISSPDLRPAFYMALRDTLVAPDLDVAVRVAYVGDKTAWRVVTKDGNLIDQSGTMSGGGNSVRSGGMKLSSGSSRKTGTAPEEREVTKADLQALEAEVAAAQQRLADCRARKAELEVQLDALKASKQTLHVEIGKLQLTARHLQEQKVELQSKHAQLSGEHALTREEQQEANKLQSRLQELEAEISRSSPQLGQRRSAVNALQRKIMDIGGPKLSRAQAKLDILTKQFDTLSATLSTKMVEESSNTKQAAKAAAAKAKAEQEAAKHSEKLADLQAEQKEMEADALQVVQAVDAAKALLAEQEKTLRAITAEFTAMKNLLAKIKAVEVDLTSEVETCHKEIKENRTQADHWRKELENVRRCHAEEWREFKSVTGESPAVKEASDMDVEEDPAAEQPQDLHEEQLALFRADRSFVEDVKKEINLLEIERDKLKSNVNMNALKEYFRKDAFYRSRLAELEAITEQRNERRKEFEGLRRERLECFMAGFGVITLKLKEMYQMITLGGDAELELVDSLDPFSEGIVFSVRPPKKSWKNISNLSGGEKTLSSLALVFALHHYKPTPLYVMDEIDAALDFKNVSIVANYIKERTKDAQFVIISLRNNMFELADRLVGIYKTHDATKSVTINPKLFDTTHVAGVSASAAAGKSSVAVNPGLKTLEDSGKQVGSKKSAKPLADATNTKMGVVGSV